MQLKRMHMDIKSEGELKRCGAHASLQPRAQLSNPIKRTIRFEEMRIENEGSGGVYSNNHDLSRYRSGLFVTKFWQFSGCYIWLLRFGILCRYFRYFIFMDIVKKFVSVLL